MGAYGLPVIINGGDSFVQRALQSGDLADTPVKGINQESVFTALDPVTGHMGPQNAETTEYFLDYLSQCKDNRLDIYLTEYAPKGNQQIRKLIEKYCRKKQYLFYIASSLNLDGQ
jgi:endo-alpha-1,4-polygalactosaminidase (GH114 family)